MEKLEEFEAGEKVNTPKGKAIILAKGQKLNLWGKPIRPTYLVELEETKDLLIIPTIWIFKMRRRKTALVRSHFRLKDTTDPNKGYLRVKTHIQKGNK